MESTDLDRTASDTEVIYFREALEKLLKVTQEGIDELEGL